MRRRLLSSAIALESEELGEAERLAGVMRERAAEADQPARREAYTARRLSYEERAARAKSRIEELRRNLEEP